MAADGTAEVVTIIVNHPRESAGASGATARAAIKARGVANAAMGTPTPTGKLVDSGVDITASTFTLAALNSPRPSSGSYGTFMMAAAGVWIYELDFIHSAAQAFGLGDSLTDVFTSATANGTKELVTLTIPGSADANPDGSDNLSLLNPGIYDRPFAFGTPQGDTIARGGDELQIIDADAGEDSANGNGKDNSPHAGSANDAVNRSDTIYEGSGTGTPPRGTRSDHGGFGEATATDAPKHVEHGTTPASAGDDSNHGQSQRDLHASEEGSAAAKQHAKHDRTGRRFQSWAIAARFARF